MFKLKGWWVALLFLGVLCFFPLAHPDSFRIDEVQDPLFKSFPVQIGAWQGTDEPLDERTYQILETKNVLSRGFAHPEGHRVHLLLVGSHRDRRVAHPPEVCYVGSDFSILEKEERVIDGGNGQVLPARHFFAKGKEGTSKDQHVLYLYKIGDRLTTNYYAQQLQFAWDRLTRKDTEILMIRLAGADRRQLDLFLPEVLSTVKRVQSTLETA